jgi:hypothetical protein
LTLVNTMAVMLVLAVLLAVSLPSSRKWSTVRSFNPCWTHGRRTECLSKWSGSLF